ncbi:hypothetical protein EFL26_00820 [Nocardioides pocheonensis]|uniref:Uncharacterized protein n=1 Tax=Nocardioides pocheonensis TaxID=661485 RepID=A0A3N0GY12_9ACTN|nr:hypothetical protein EFL26_00820 [Nocardioides pocheonensis]
MLVESSSADRMESGVASVFSHNRKRHYLAGMRGFERFRQDGFHATNDPLEVRMAFVDFLADTLDFKSMIVYSDRSTRPDLSDKQRLMIVFDQLVHDVLGAYRSRPKVVFCFESAEGMDSYVEQVVLRAARTFGRRAPEIEVRFGAKQSPYMLAVPDYVLHIFGQWRSDGAGTELEVDPKENRSRTFRAILGSISVARSLDDARVVRRTLG